MWQTKSTKDEKEIDTDKKKQETLGRDIRENRRHRLALNNHKPGRYGKTELE